MESDLGLILWRSLRDVHVCSQVEPNERRRYFRAPTTEVRERFAAACAEVPELSGPLSTFMELLQTPVSVSGTDLAVACHDVYEWADSRGLRLIAYHFAEAAAYADPFDPARANFAARMARRSLMKDRASLWYLRAHRIALVSRRKREAIYALLGYGTMMKDVGNFEEARRAFERAAHRATASGRKREAAEAYHDLFTIALELGQFQLSERHLRKALSLYPVRHSRIPALAYDIGFLLIRECHFSAALMVLERTAPLIREPEEQVLVWSAIAWGAAGSDKGARYEEAERITLERLSVFDDFASATYIHLAEACRALRRWDRAASYAEAGRNAATQRGEIPLAREAEGLLNAIRRRDDAPPPAEEAVPASSLARAAALRLHKWTLSPGRGRPGTGADLVT